jgi:hypothetical protein
MLAQKPIFDKDALPPNLSCLRDQAVKRQQIRPTAGMFQNHPVFEIVNILNFERFLLTCLQK